MQKLGFLLMLAALFSNCQSLAKTVKKSRKKTRNHNLTMQIIKDSDKPNYKVIALKTTIAGVGIGLLAWFCFWLRRDSIRNSPNHTIYIRRLNGQKLLHSNFADIDRERNKLSTEPSSLAVQIITHNAVKEFDTWQAFIDAYNSNNSELMAILKNEQPQTAEANEQYDINELFAKSQRQQQALQLLAHTQRPQ